MTVSRLWLCGGTEEVKKEGGHRVHCGRTGAPWRLVPSRWLVHFLRLSELWSGCRIKIYCCEIKISVNVRPNVCPRTTSLFMPISSDGLCSLHLPSSSSWPASMKMKSACEKGSTTEREKKECFIYKKQVNLRLAVSTRDRLTDPTQRQRHGTRRLRGKRERGENKLSVRPACCCVLCPLARGAAATRKSF